MEERKRGLEKKKEETKLHRRLCMSNMVFSCHSYWRLVTAIAFLYLKCLLNVCPHTLFRVTVTLYMRKYF